MIRRRREARLCSNVIRLSSKCSHNDSIIMGLLSLIDDDHDESRTLGHPGHAVTAGPRLTTGQVMRPLKRLLDGSRHAVRRICYPQETT